MTIKEKYKFTFVTIDTGSELIYQCESKNNLTNEKNQLSWFISYLQEYDIVDFVLDEIDETTKRFSIDNELLSDHWPDSDEIRISKSFFKINESEFPIEDVNELLLEWRKFINPRKHDPLLLKKARFGIINFIDKVYWRITKP